MEKHANIVPETWSAWKMICPLAWNETASCFIGYRCWFQGVCGKVLNISLWYWDYQVYNVTPRAIRSCGTLWRLAIGVRGPWIHRTQGMVCLPLDFRVSTGSCPYMWLGFIMDGINCFLVDMFGACFGNTCLVAKFNAFTRSKWCDFSWGLVILVKLSSYSTRIWTVYEGYII